jgi:Uma2 family endonuclease
LVVEVLSPENPERERIVKRSLYARDGVPEYWIVDPRERGVEVFVLDGNVCVPRGFFKDGESAVSCLLAGFSIPVAAIFA